MSQPAPTAVQWKRLADALHTYFETALGNHERGARYDAIDVAMSAAGGLDSGTMKAIGAVLESEPELRAVLYVDAAGTPISDVSGSSLWNFLVGRLVATYLDAAADVDGLDAVAFENVVSRLEQETDTGIEETRITLPLPGLELADGEILLEDGVRIRAIPEEERQRWLQQGMISSRDPHSHSLRAALEVRYSQKRPADFATQSAAETAATERARRLLLSVQLVADTAASPLFTEKRSLSVLAMGHSFSTNAYLRSPFATGVVGSGMLESIRATMRAIEEMAALPTIDLALRRWSDAQWRVRPDDQIIDCWIALEALLCRGSTQEVQFRAALRLAALIGDPSERRSLYDAARSSYQCRSLLVHGESTAKFNLVAEAASARTWLRRVLLKVLWDGLPDDLSVIEKALLEQ